MPHAEFAYNRSVYSVIKYSLFEDGETVHDFSDKTLIIIAKCDCMEMVFQKVHTDAVYLYKARTFVCSELRS